MKPTRATQPYRASGFRPQTQTLMNILRGRTVGGYNPADAERGLQRMSKAMKRHRTRKRPPRPARPTRPAR